MTLQRVFSYQHLKIGELYLYNSHDNYIAIVQCLKPSYFKIIKNINKRDYLQNANLYIEISSIYILSSLDKIKYL